MSLSLEEITECVRRSYELPNRVCEAIPSPVVTVRTSAYKHEKYIRQCIEGVLMQETSFPFEYIIGEDCSPDGTRDIVMEYARKYPDRIRVLTADSNVGCNANGTRCQEAARGKYTANCEGDDYWIDRRKLQMQVDAMETDSNISMCATRCLVKKETEGKGVDMVGAAGSKPECTCRDFLRGSVVNTCTTMYRTEGALKRIEWGRDFVWGDRVLCISETLDGSVCRVLSPVTAVYRVTGKGLWSGGGHGIASMPAEMERFYEILMEKVPDDLKTIAREEWVFARAWRLKKENRREFLRFASRHLPELARSAYLKRKKWCSLYRSKPQT